MLHSRSACAPSRLSGDRNSRRREGDPNDEPDFAALGDTSSTVHASDPAPAPVGPRLRWQGMFVNDRAVDKQVLVRSPSASDRDQFIEAMRASRRFHRPWLAMPETADGYERYLERAQLQTCAYFLACRREDDAIVGFINISEIIRGKLQSAFVGYGAVAGFIGRGYMTEAMGLVLREAFTRLRLHRLEAN